MEMRILYVNLIVYSMAVKLVRIMFVQNAVLVHKIHLFTNLPTIQILTAMNAFQSPVKCRTVRNAILLTLTPARNVPKIINRKPIKIVLHSALKIPRISIMMFVRSSAK